MAVTMAERDRFDDGWTVGQLAAATGVTVRALHHYDELGLLTPRGRNSAGYRLYGRAELERLYVVVALRELGLSLENIASFLDDDPDELPGRKLRNVVKRHLDEVRRQRRLHELLEWRLHRLLTDLDTSSDPVSSRQIREILEVTSMHRKYYTPEQLAELEKRRLELGPEGLERAQQDWQELIAEVTREKENGTAPSSARMQELAKRWQALIDAFTGGDPGIRTSLQNMYESEGSQNASRGMIDPELMDYVGEALRARS